MQRDINPEQIQRDVVVIGASAGGISAVTALLSRLPRALPAVLGVVIHRGGWSTTDWAHLLGRDSELHVIEPASGTSVAKGTVYVARPDHHMRFRNGQVVHDQTTKEHHTRPAVDPLFSSAAAEFGARVLGIVLTGGGSDGTDGLRDIVSAGGIALVQKPSEAQHGYMPSHALRFDHVSAALSIAELADAIVALAHGRAFSTREM